MILIFYSFFQPSTWEKLIFLLQNLNLFLYLGGIASATQTLLLLITRINERRSLLRSVRINNETFLKTRINALRLCGLDTFQ